MSDFEQVRIKLTPTQKKQLASLFALSQAAYEQSTISEGKGMIFCQAWDEHAGNGEDAGMVTCTFIPPPYAKQLSQLGGRIRRKLTKGK